MQLLMLDGRRVPQGFPARHSRALPGHDAVRLVQEELGPCVGCTLESDIFRALGLAYVPFHLRWWYGYE